MAGAIINVSGSFSRTLSLVPEMPQPQWLFVYSQAQINANGEITNLGTMDDGVIIGDPTIANGEIITDDNLSRIVYGSLEPDANGHRMPALNNGYSFAAYTKNLQRGAFGGMILRDSENVIADQGRFLAVNGPSASDADNVLHPCIRNADAGNVRMEGDAVAGIECVVVGTYGSLDAAPDDPGFKVLVMTADGNYTITESDTPTARPGDEYRVNNVEWGSNTVNSFEEWQTPSSQFAMWGANLTPEEMVQAAKSMLGIVEL